ncbi:MAG: hypothetical protein U0X92_17580 [Anaerolineales bacterium]
MSNLFKMAMRQIRVSVARGDDDLALFRDAETPVTMLPAGWARMALLAGRRRARSSRRDRGRW